MKWKTASTRIAGAQGVHDLYLVFKGDTGLLLNFDWWKFNKK